MIRAASCRKVLCPGTIGWAGQQVRSANAMKTIQIERPATTTVPFLIVLLVSGALVFALPTGVRCQTAQDATLRSATTVLREIQGIPASSIPQGLLFQARAITIVPGVIKIGFIGSIRRGRGVTLVRNADGGWGDPIFVTLTGGGVGWQAGVQSTDVILVFNSAESVQGMLRGKFTLGADASVAAGPVGREAAAATDLKLASEVLSYSRSRGLFAGLALNGSMIAVDHTANTAYYAPLGRTAGDQTARQDLPLTQAAVDLKTLLAAQSSLPVTATGAASPAFPAALPEPPTTPTLAPSAARLQPTRTELVTAMQRLYTRLDDRWRSFLAMPAELTDPKAAPNVDSVRRLSARFQQVQGDAKYQGITGLTEFQSAYDLLKKYAAEVSLLTSSKASP
jgi:lipid-binding SYLF domain-containing protein